MKRIFFAAAALMAGLVAAPAMADEMPIRGVCTDGTDTVTFHGSRQPVTDPLTGDFGLTYIWMTTDAYNTMFAPAVHIVPGRTPEKNGLQAAGIGELSVAVKVDELDNLAVIRASTQNLEDAMKTYLPQWKCDIKPNF